MALKLICLVIFLLSPAAWAGTTDDRAASLMREIRCTVCNAQSIADSDASLAADLRREVSARIAAGESDTAIKESLRQRFGDRILLEPPLRTDTVPLWAAPIVLLLLAIGISSRLIGRRRA